ncbi:Gfo/Idh/MocA family protein [Spongiimicrobium sp. 3-5]|uniref:Gfo/Idh/MocA family protein n=1 Tax=Spongiimicrobium sp. 3-5 TaxID=3332596 RepID=UPI0039813801
MGKKVKWGIVGLGKIAKLFVDDLLLVKDAELIAVASTNSERAKVFAQEYGVNSYYGSYLELFNNKEVDVVYVATLHHTHAKVSIAAMDHKKHVLCEKPVAISALEAKQMIASSIRNKVFFMEAFWSRFNPTIKKTKELVDAGALGRLRYISAEFTFYKLDEDPKSRALNIDLAGGSLLDMGVYPIFLSYLLLGKPAEILARSKFHWTGAEIQTSMIFNYKDAQAMLYSGFSNDTDMKAKICGEDAEIYVAPIWHEAQGFTLVNNGKERLYKLPTKGKGFTYEICEVHKCLQNGKLESSLWSHQNSLELMNIVDEVRKKAGIRFSFES